MSQNYENMPSIYDIETLSPRQGSIISSKMVAQRLLKHRVKKIFDSADYYMEKQLIKSKSGLSTSSTNSSSDFSPDQESLSPLQQRKISRALAISP